MTTQTYSDYYFDSNGYLLPAAFGSAGSTTVKPPTSIPAGQQPKWNGKTWALVTAALPANFSTLPQTLAYDATSGNLTSVTAGPDSDGHAYVQTLSYTGGKLTSVSAWVKQ